MHKLFIVFTLLITFFTIQNASHAADRPDFIFPLACTLGTDCWTVNYVDMNPAKNFAEDFACEKRTYDGHKGTDFAVRSFTELRSGIDILAAKSGNVVRLRNGESDSIKSEKELEDIKSAKKECGNAVLINHENGLKTLYCHMKKDSITVKVGEIVNAGQKIGQIGHSGFTEFPHLHFGVVWEDGVIDPYTGALNIDGCDKNKQSLWAPGQPLKYEPFALYDGGFTHKVPDFEAIKRGKTTPQITNNNAFVFWGAIYGAIKGDKITLTILDPDGNPYIIRENIQEKTRVQQFYYTGRKLYSHTPLKSGLYTGTITLKREGIEPKTLRKEITIP